jgi:glucokinase
VLNPIIARSQGDASTQEAAMITLAIDVGGTKVAVAAVNQYGALLKKLQQPTDLSGPQMVVDQIVAMSKQILGAETVGAIGICVPAVLEAGSDRILWAPNLPGWEGTDLKAMLTEQYGVPTAVEYDGHAAVLGEWWAGKGRGYESVACVTIGTGIGAGFIVDGRLWKGRNRLAGAVGWFPVTTNDGMVHWEAAAAGPAIARHAQQKVAQGKSSLLSSTEFTAKDVFDAAQQGDAVACEVIEQAAKTIGLGIATVISFANPEIVILGGSIGQNADMMLPIVQRTAIEWAQPYSARDLPIVCSKLGEEAGLLGAAYSAFQQIEP